MSTTPRPRSAATDRFRIRLLVAMMMLVSGITGTALYFAQRSARTDVQKNLTHDFQSAIAPLLHAQAAHLSAIVERCRVLARSVRIRAALEEGAVEDLYLTADVELRDILERDAQTRGGEANLLRAKFFRFLDADGKVMSPTRAGESGDPDDWQSQLNMPGAPDEQQVGYVVERAADGRERINEVIATPIIATDTGESIGAIVLGFQPVELEHQTAEIKSGIWLNGQLHMPALPAAARAALAGEVTAAVGPVGPAESNFSTTIDGTPYLLLSKLLNPDSRYPSAYQVALYPLTESLARQRHVRWQILGGGALLLLGGLTVSHFVSKRFAAPVEDLAIVSAENAEQRERAEAALELTNEELRARNIELQEAIAKLQAAQQQIIQQERLRALGEMASGIAHDFNNALVPIQGFSELLLISPAILADGKKAASYLETIHTAAQDAASVVSRLREFYRGKGEGETFTAVDLKRLVEQAIRLTQPRWKDQAQARGATVLVATELADVPPVAGDESALREVLTNLIFNAVDAMPGSGTITIRTRVAGDSAVLEVADTGTGMTEEVRQRCLEPFFSTKGERGTGLGLSMVFGIVHRHGGSLDVRSTLGEGTSFIITLPLHHATADPATEALPSATAQRHLRVLVVDDEPQVRELLTAALTNDGHDVEVANQGAEGLRCFKAGHFDLVVTDKAMPVMSGEQMATEIKRLAPHTPIILLTGFGQFLDLDHLPGIDVLASKPISIPALRNAITTAMQAA